MANANTLGSNSPPPPPLHPPLQPPPSYSPKKQAEEGAKLWVCCAGSCIRLITTLCSGCAVTEVQRERKATKRS